MAEINEATGVTGTYNDPSPVDRNKLHQISELTRFIRQKVYGIDVRETIAQIAERLYIDATEMGNANMEVSSARGFYDNLNDRITDIDERLVTKLNSIISGAPQKAFGSLDELKAAYPNGAEGIMVTKDTGNWYFWSGSVWELGGKYQSALDADFQKGSYIERVMGINQKVKSDIKLLSMYSGTNPLFSKATFDNEQVVVEPGGYFFPIMNYMDARDVYITLSGVSHPSRVSMSLEGTGQEIMYFELKGSSVDNVYYFDMNDYVGFATQAGSYFKLRIDNRDQSDRVTVNQFLVGKGGIPISVNDSLFYIDRNITSRTISTLETVPTDMSILTRNSTKEYLATFDGNSITIDATGYVFMTLPVAKAKDVYLTLSQVNHPDRLSFRIKNGSTGVTGMLPFNGSVADNIYYLDFNDYLGQSTTPASDEFEIRLDNRDKTDQLVIDQFLIGRGGLPTGKTITSDKTVYVDPNGTFKTIQSAIDSGATNIFVKPGIYKESISVGGRDTLTISSIPEADYNVTSKTDTQGVVIDMTTALELISDDTIFSMAKTAPVGSRLEKTFISKTLPIVIFGRSDGYNATLWEDTGDIKTSKRLVPVASQVECKSTRGTFTYDGTKIWVNPFNGTISGKTFKLLDDIDVVASFTDISNLTLSGLKFIGGYSNTLFVKKVAKFDFTKTTANRSGLGNGFGVEDSNGTFTACTANQNKNDGFNFHGFGDTHLVDCEGHYNFDDGNSHHDGTTGTIVRGEWSQNGKGGCSPTYGSIVHVDSVYSHDNNYGIYLETLPENPLRTVRHTNCVLKNNSTSDYFIGEKYNILGINNLYASQTGTGTYTKLN